MVADDAVDLRCELLTELAQNLLRVEKPRGGHLHAHIGNRGQRTRDRIMLITGDEYGVPGLYNGLDGNVEPVGGIQ